MPKKSVKSQKSKPSVAILTLKGSPEYKQWIAELSAKTHIATTVLYRLAIAEWAERNGHPKPPEI